MNQRAIRRSVERRFEAPRGRFDRTNVSMSMSEEGRQPLAKPIWVPSLALPHHQYAPSGATQSPHDGSVAFHITTEFGEPVRAIRLWLPRSSWASVLVPVAPVDEHHRAEPRERQVRRARQIAPVQPESVAERMCDRADDPFGRCISRADQGHDLASSQHRVVTSPRCASQVSRAWRSRHRCKCETTQTTAPPCPSPRAPRAR